jgi:2'-5' RNA ligase
MGRNFDLWKGDAPVSDEKDPVLAKIEEIKRRGQQARESGMVRFFTEFPDSLHRRSSTFLMAGFWPDNPELYGLCKVLAESTVEVGLKPVSAGRDFNAHATILEGEPKSESEDRLLQPICGVLNEEGAYNGWSFAPLAYFDELVVDECGSILLLSRTVPEWLIEVRSAMAARFNAHGYQPRPMDHLFHLTLQRTQAGTATDVFAAAQKLAERLPVLEQRIRVHFYALYRGEAGYFFRR